MRQMKKFFAVVLAVCLSASSLPPGEFRVAAATGTERTTESTESLMRSAEDLQVYSTDYFGRQLTEEAEQVFYNALDDMYNAGEFKKGVVSWEVQAGAEEGMLPTSLLDAYMMGDASLLQMFQNASNAFMMDKNDLFYVDWTRLSVRVGKKNGTWSVHIGNGAYETLCLTSAGYGDAAKIDADMNAMY